jgi:hypothetical protein
VLLLLLAGLSSRRAAHTPLVLGTLMGKSSLVYLIPGFEVLMVIPKVTLTCGFQRMSRTMRISMHLVESILVDVTKPPTHSECLKPSGQGRHVMKQIRMGNLRLISVMLNTLEN